MLVQSPVNSSAPTAAGQRQFVIGAFADVTRLPLTRPHRLHFGPHAGSFASQADAIAAARQLSAGAAPAHVVTSFPASLDTSDRWRETSRYNVYPVDDVTGPRFGGPDVIWGPWNTTTRPYHFGSVPGVLGLTGHDTAEVAWFMRDILLVDGTETAQITPRR